MTTLSITDLNTFLNNQMNAHEKLSEQLLQIQQVVDFTASSDLVTPNPLQLNAQFIAIEKLLQEAQALNQHLQHSLLTYPTLK